MRQVFLKIYGLVQGVCFRFFVEKTASNLGIRGWVKNCSDGSVEAIALGNEESVSAFIKKCRIGPTSARVEKVDVNEMEPEEFRGFNIRF